MSLSAVAPTEKTENLIYTLLPVSVTLCLASVFLPDPGTWLYWVGALAPIFSILLYEIGWDEKKVMKQHQEKLQANSTTGTFYNCNLFIRIWETTLQKPPTLNDFTEHLESEVKTLVSSTVSSYTARRRFWRQRASFYILKSIPWLAVIPPRLLDLGMRNYIQQDLLGLWFLLLLVVWIVFTFPTRYWIRKAKNKRDDDIEFFLKNLISYIYWQTMIATDAVRNHAEYQPNSEKWIVKSELESLDIILTRLDWRIFLERWMRVKEHIEDVAINNFKSEFESRAYSLWAKFIYDTRKARESQQSLRQFAWLIYYSDEAKIHLQETARELLEYLNQESKASPDLQSLLDPNDIIDRFPEQLLTDEREEYPLTMTVSNALNILFRNSAGDTDTAIRRIIMYLTTPLDVGLDEGKMARLVYRYIKERTALGMESFLKGYRADHILHTAGVVQSDDNRVWVIVDWFREVKPAEMVKALETRGWQGILTDLPLSQAVLERVRRFEGREYGEIRALELLERIFGSDSDTLAKLIAIRERLEDKPR